MTTPMMVTIISQPITTHSSANQNVRNCQRKCESRNVPAASLRFT